MIDGGRLDMTPRGSHGSSLGSWSSKVRRQWRSPARTVGRVSVVSWLLGSIAFLSGGVDQAVRDAFSLSPGTLLARPVRASTGRYAGATRHRRCLEALAHAAQGSDDEGGAPAGDGYHVAGLSNLAHEMAINKEAGPDENRGYCVKEYRGLWHALNKDHQWPSVQHLAAVGPAGDAFRQAAENCVVEALGWEAVSVDVRQKSGARWQSVRLAARCASPDDFCMLHSRLKELEGCKAVL